MYDDDRDALAAEYVLGTLSADERDQAEAMLVIDPGFAEMVRVWERRLGELNVMVEAVEPPPDLWDKISTGIDGGARRAKVETDFPALGEAAPTPGITPETTGEMTSGPEEEPDLLAQAAQDLNLKDLNLKDLDPKDLEPKDLDLSGPRDLDDASMVAALASSLLPPESAAEPAPAPEPEQSEVPPSEPASAVAPPKIERSADIIYLAREARRWRGFTVAMSAIAALLAIYVAVAQFVPGLLPLNRRSQTVLAGAGQANPPGARLVAVLQQEPTAPAFLLTVDLQNRTLTARRLTAAPDADRSYELWLIPDKASSPHSLGLVGNEEFTTRPIPADADADALRSASYAVSLEPAGGSQKGVPTGPILFTGTMVQSLPGSPS
jgi:anti-sigma-K factor RskA